MNEVLLPDPTIVQMSDGKFLWYDETYNVYGPCETREEAQEQQRLYCLTFLDNHDIDYVEDDVRRFHQKFGRPVGTKPGDNFDNEGERRLRAALVLEEALEYVEAMGFDPKAMFEAHQKILAQQRGMGRDKSGQIDASIPESALKQANGTPQGFTPPPDLTPDLAKAMDAAADIIYVAAGGAVTFGVRLGPIWSEVQRTNMAKEGGALRSDGKILKPADWKPPDVEALLKAQGWKS